MLDFKWIHSEDGVQAVGHLSTVCLVAALNIYALTGSVDKTVKLWKLDPDVKDDQRLLKTFVGHYKRVRFGRTTIHNQPILPGDSNCRLQNSNGETKYKKRVRVRQGENGLTNKTFPNLNVKKINVENSKSIPIKFPNKLKQFPFLFFLKGKGG